MSSEKLTFVNKNKVFTSSLIIARGMGIDHRAVRALIKRHIACLKSFARVTFEMQPLETNGGCQQAAVYILSEEQATFVIALMKNTPQVVKFKKKLVEQFYEMRKFIDNLSRARDGYKELSEALYKSYGDTADPHIFSNEANMINRIALGMTAKQKIKELGLKNNEPLREHLSVEQVTALDRLQQADIYLISTGLPYKERKAKLMEYYKSMIDKPIGENKDCA